jgi:hypothetical protein
VGHVRLRSKLPVPQRLKPPSLLAPDGTTERRALPINIYERRCNIQWQDRRVVRTPEEFRVSAAEELCHSAKGMQNDEV